MKFNPDVDTMSHDWKQYSEKTQQFAQPMLGSEEGEISVVEESSKHSVER